MRGVIQKKRTRIQWIDNLRGFAILLVIIGHCLQYFGDDFDHNHLANYIYSFHMPLFFWLSGFCSYKETYSLNDLKKRAQQLLIPFCVWSLTFCGILQQSVFSVMVKAPVYWFLILLFIIYCFHLLCIWISIRIGIKYEKLAILIVCCSYFLQHYFQNSYFSLDLLYIHFFFFSLGFCCRKFNLITLVQNHCHGGLIACCTISFMFFGYFYQKSIAPEFWGNLPVFAYFIMTGVFGILFSVLLFFYFMDKNNWMLSRFGKYSLGIYVIQGLIFHITYSNSKIFSFFESFNNTIVIIVVSCIVSAMSLLITMATSKDTHTKILIGLR